MMVWQNGQILLCSVISVIYIAAHWSTPSLHCSQRWRSISNVFRIGCCISVKYNVFRQSMVKKNVWRLNGFSIILIHIQRILWIIFLDTFDIAGKRHGYVMLWFINLRWFVYGDDFHYFYCIRKMSAFRDILIDYIPSYNNYTRHIFNVRYVHSMITVYV